MIISCQNVQKYHGAQLVLSDITFDIRQGEKIGLIGRNGCGKTTLFRLLSSEERPDQGQISIRRNSIIGLLSQIHKRTATRRCMPCSSAASRNPGGSSACGNWSRKCPD